MSVTGVLSLLLLAAGGSLAVSAAAYARAAWASRGWSRVRGTVRVAEVVLEEPHDDAPPKRVLEVRYRYEVAGRTYFGDRWRADGNALDADSDARGELRRFAPGSEVWVWHDPARPERSLLEPGHDSAVTARLALGAAVLLALGAAGLAGFLGG